MQISGATLDANLQVEDAVTHVMLLAVAKQCEAFSESRRLSSVAQET